MQDTLGVEILPTDRVLVTSWGLGARLVDCGIKRPVIRLNRKRVVIEDLDGFQRAIEPKNLAVLRRDGADGLEGNKDRN